MGDIMFKAFIALLKKPPAKVIAQTELEESQRQHLRHEMAAIYHTKMAEYYNSNVIRFGAYIKKA